jgi:phosphoribosylanthranilate isomerase
MLRVKICGITKPDQGHAIAQLGATALGFICVHSSPRYVTPQQIREVMARLSGNIDKIGVFANRSLDMIREVVEETGINGVQLHGDESPEFCDRVRQLFPDIELIKAFRVKNPEVLSQTLSYANSVNTFLLDAYHPTQLGGTGHTLDWRSLTKFQFPCPWLLAGGLTPDNILDALSEIHPHGIDLSSGVERSPGDKDLTKVSHLFLQLNTKEEGRRNKE